MKRNHKQKKAKISETERKKRVIFKAGQADKRYQPAMRTTAKNRYYERNYMRNETKGNRIECAQKKAKRITRRRRKKESKAKWATTDK